MKFKKTKIIATLGPASSSKEMIKKLIKSGVDVLRVNFSHATHDEVERIVDDVNDLRKELGSNVTLLGDLQGPKIRIGELENDIELKKNQSLSICSILSESNGIDKVFISYPSFAKDVKPGENILVDDGKLIFKVISTNKKDTVDIKVVQEGVLKPRKGVNLPNTKISQPALTEKDIDDAIKLLNKAIWILIKNLENQIKFNIFKNLLRANKTPGSLTYLWSLCEKKNFEWYTAIWGASFGKLFWNDVKND